MAIVLTCRAAGPKGASVLSLAPTSPGSRLIGVPTNDPIGARRRVPTTARPSSASTSGSAAVGSPRRRYAEGAAEADCHSVAASLVEDRESCDVRGQLAEVVHETVRRPLLGRVPGDNYTPVPCSWPDVVTTR